jgi:hypothetical protein
MYMNTQHNGSQAPHDDHAEGFPDAVKAGMGRRRDQSIWPISNGMEAAARQARDATDQFSRVLGFSGEKSERLAHQSKKNREAVKQCRAVLTQAFQASSQNWMEMVQGQWKRNFDGMERLMHAKSVHEFGAIQGELVRENLEHILKDSRSIAERSMRAADEAGKALSSMTGQGANAPA